MENYLFRATMPYLVEIHDREISIKNRYYKSLYEFTSPIKLSMEMFYDFVDNDTDQQFLEDSISKLYLYDDNSNPIGENKDALNYSKLIPYFLRLTNLFDFCKKNSSDFEDNDVFSYIMPYGVKQSNEIIEVFNRHNTPLFKAFSKKKIDDESGFADFYDFDEKCTYLYINYSFDCLNDDLIMYYMRLTYLFVFCSGLQHTSDNPLIHG